MHVPLFPLTPPGLERGRVVCASYGVLYNDIKYACVSVDFLDSAGPKHLHAVALGWSWSQHVIERALVTSPRETKTEVS